MIHVVQSDPEVPPGELLPALARHGAPWRLVRLAAGEALPDGATALIVLGGRMGVDEIRQYPFLLPLKTALRTAISAGLPTLGICLGGQLLAEAAGGVVSRRHGGERGMIEVTLTAVDDPLFAGLPSPCPFFAWHDDSFSLPPGAVHLAGSARCPVQAFRLGNAWGVQFHPEVDSAIVAGWCADDPQRAALTAAFAGHAASLRAQAALFFANFLARTVSP